MVRDNDFNTYRSLNEYKEDFLPQFLEELSNLNAASVWVDAGAGLARAQVEYLQSLAGDTPRLIAASYKYPKKTGNMERNFNFPNYRKKFLSATRAKKLAYSEGDIVELGSKLDLNGKVTLLTDNHGPATYSDLTRILIAYGTLLKAGGHAFIDMPTIVIQETDESGTERISSKEKFFRQIKGFTVNVVNQGTYTKIHLVRTAAELYVPELEPLGARLEVDTYDARFLWHRRISP